MELLDTPRNIKIVRVQVAPTWPITTHGRGAEGEIVTDEIEADVEELVAFVQSGMLKPVEIPKGAHDALRTYAHNRLPSLNAEAAALHRILAVTGA